MLHDGGGGTEVHQIHVAACKICQIAGEVEQGDDVGVALDQHGQVEIAVRGGVSGDATAKGVDGQQAGQVAAQVLDDEITGRGVHLCMVPAACAAEPGRLMSADCRCSGGGLMKRWASALARRPG